MGEADFGAVDEAIADGFEEDEGVVVGGVEEDLFYLLLYGMSAVDATVIPLSVYSTCL